MKAGEERTQIAKGIHSESKQPEEIILLSGQCSDSLNVSLCQITSRCVALSGSLLSTLLETQG